MAIKTTTTSNHPNFQRFDEWIEGKIAVAQAADDTAEVQKIRAALAAKASAAAAAGVNIESVDFSNNNGVLTETVVKSAEPAEVPDFNQYWDQWAAEFSVQGQIEEI